MVRCVHLNRISQKLKQFVIPQRFVSKTSIMANSRFDYVRNFEQDDTILPNCWIVVRIDGKAFHKFTQKHDFIKPNDDNGKNNNFLLDSFQNKKSSNCFIFLLVRFEFNELCGNKSDERI